MFDGIATGLLVLKDLGIEVECYVASEIDQDAMYVSQVQHNEIIHVGNVKRITEKEVGSIAKGGKSGLSKGGGGGGGGSGFGRAPPGEGTC